MTADQLADAFPSIERIEDDDLRAGVREAWATAMAENGIDSLESLPWYPPAQRKLDLPDETFVEHVRDVVAGALAFGEMLIEHRDADLDLDRLLAGALVHDISKLYEFDGMESTRIEELLGHPHYGVHVTAAAGLPVEVTHMVLSHTSRTAVEPATLEAVVLRRADEAAAAAIRWEATDDLREV